VSARLDDPQRRAHLTTSAREGTEVSRTRSVARRRPQREAGDVLLRGLGRCGALPQVRSATECCEAHHGVPHGDRDAHNAAEFPSTEGSLGPDLQQLDEEGRATRSGRAAIV
jgi:hypothetical protein